jgi:hypothetical protein
MFEATLTTSLRSFSKVRRHLYKDIKELHVQTENIKVHRKFAVIVLLAGGDFLSTVFDQMSNSSNEK